MPSGGRNTLVSKCKNDKIKFKKEIKIIIKALS
jgi:hypothetical protein